MPNKMTELEKKEKKKKCCIKDPDNVRMPNRIEIKRCRVDKLPPHPCDPPGSCDPCADDEGGCPKPILCLERLKNPAIPGETTKCQPGAHLNVQACKRPDPPHPCDFLKCIPGFRKKVKCPPAAVCWERLKNPEPKKAIVCPNNTYEAVQPKIVPCKPPKVICAPECPQIPVEVTKRN